MLPDTGFVKAAVVTINSACSNIAPHQITKNNILCSPILGLLPRGSPVPVELIVAGHFSFSCFFTPCHHGSFFAVIYCPIRDHSSLWPFTGFINVVWIACACIYHSAVSCPDEGKRSLAVISLGFRQSWRPSHKLRCELCLVQWSSCHSPLKESVSAVSFPVVYLRAAELPGLEETSGSHLIYSLQLKQGQL